MFVRLRHSAVRKAGLVALVLTSTLALAACGDLQDTNPRLTSIAAVQPAPSVAESTAPEQTAPVDSGPLCAAGDYQLEVEQALAKIGNYGPITVDGKQSAQDCATIAAFQKRMGIGTWQGENIGSERNGTPGPITKDVAQRIAATDPSECGYSDKPQACVDLTHQTFFIVSGGQVILGPTVARTGKPGFRTPSGSFEIMGRNPNEWSVPYSVWLRYWENFYGGDGLHETTTYIHDMWRGSHGCVNLLHDDAVRAYSLLSTGSVVHLYGRRPGT
jgi:lipoprotein-anchoring transpeptidase ErfK/SrfK